MTSSIFTWRGKKNRVILRLPNGEMYCFPNTDGGWLRRVKLTAPYPQMIEMPREAIAAFRQIWCIPLAVLWPGYTGT
jgi:hypothetical protein